MKREMRNLEKKCSNCKRKFKLSKRQLLKKLEMRSLDKVRLGLATEILTATGTLAVEHVGTVESMVTSNMDGTIE